MYTTRIKGSDNVLYNACGTENLPSVDLRADDVSPVAGGLRIVPAGSIVCATSKIATNSLLKRSWIINPYTAGQDQVLVRNPSVFKPGDILYRLAEPGDSKTTEIQTIRGGSAPIFGTVTAVESIEKCHSVTVTPSNVVAGNLLSVTIGHRVTFSYVATSSNVADAVAGLKKAFDSIKSPLGELEEIDAVAGTTQLTLTSNEPGAIFTVSATGSAGSAGTAPTVNVAVSTPVGALTITPDPAGSGTNAPVGTKVGSVGDVITGFINHTYYLNTYDQEFPRDRQIGAYSAGMVYSLKFPYLDGDVVDQLSKVSFSPAYKVGQLV